MNLVFTLFSTEFFGTCEEIWQTSMLGKIFENFLVCSWISVHLSQDLDAISLITPWWAGWSWLPPSHTGIFAVLYKVNQGAIFLELIATVTVVTIVGFAVYLQAETLIPASSSFELLLASILVYLEIRQQSSIHFV